MTGISAFIKRPEGACLPLPPGEGTAEKHHL